MCSLLSLLVIIVVVIIVVVIVAIIVVVAILIVVIDYCCLLLLLLCMYKSISWSSFVSCLLAPSRPGACEFLLQTWIKFFSFLGATQVADKAPGGVSGQLCSGYMPSRWSIQWTFGRKAKLGQHQLLSWIGAATICRGHRERKSSQVRSFVWQQSWVQLQGFTFSFLLLVSSILFIPDWISSHQNTSATQFGKSYLQSSPVKIIPVRHLHSLQSRLHQDCAGSAWKGCAIESYCCYFASLPHRRGRPKCACCTK